MSRTIYVGNLPYDASEGQLRDWFSDNGFPIESVSIVTDKLSGMPRGFGYVQMKEEVAAGCVLACNGGSFLGRTLVVNDLNRPKTAPRNRLAAHSGSE